MTALKDPPDWKTLRDLLVTTIEEVHEGCRYDGRRHRVGGVAISPATSE